MIISDLVRKYRRSINPPYDSRDFISLFLTVFLLITIPLTVISVLQTRELASKAINNPGSLPAVGKIYCSAQPLERLGEKPDKNRAQTVASKLAGVSADLTQKQKEFKKNGSVQAAQELQNLLKERKSDLVETMRQNPDQALNSLLSDQGISNFVPLAQNCTERSTTVEGKLEVVAADFFKEGIGTTAYTLKTDSGEKISLHPAGGIRPFVESRTRVKVKGMQIDNDLVFDGSRPLSQASDPKGGIDVVSQPGNPPVLGQQKVVTLLVNFQNTTQPAFTIAQTDNFVDTQINNFYVENSYNKISITGDVFGWYTIPINQTCDLNSVETAAIAAADPYVYFPNYARLIIIAPYGPSCGWAGMAVIGKTTVYTADGNPSLSVAWIGSSYGLNLGLVGHELGHNFGNDHASLLNCGSVTIAPLVDCTVYEYGDPYDIMGNTNPPLYFNAAHEETVGWFDPANIKTVTTSGTFVLEPIETATAGLKALKIQRSSSSPPDYLYVEYRQPIGFDSGMSQSSDVFQGALLHNLIYQGKTDLLDPTPPFSVSTIVVTPGSSFTDPDTGTRIAVTSATTTALTVNVVLGKSDFISPTVLITAPSSGVTISGSSVPVSATANDNVGVTRVEFYYDSTNLIGTGAASPYSVNWNTTGVSNGSHSLLAKAYDAASNVGTSSPISVIVNNTSSKFGDLNGDNKVDIFDLSILLSNWGATSEAVNKNADINNDGAINIFDLSILLTNWGP